MTDSADSISELATGASGLTTVTVPAASGSDASAPTVEETSSAVTGGLVAVTPLPQRPSYLGLQAPHWKALGLLVAL